MATFGIKFGTYTVGTNVFIEALKVASGRRIDQFPIVRSDMTVIPEGKATPIQIDISGTLYGSDYTSLRTAIQTLKNAVTGVKKSFYIDGERYIRVVSKTVDYAFITKDFANFNASLIGEMPYFLADVASTDIRLPVSAATYQINNTSDVNVPLKVSIQAPAAGVALGTTITFENKTLGLLWQFLGALGATSTLVVDSGYDDYNRPTFKVEVDGVSAMSAFQGDFMALDPGTNMLALTMSAGAVVSTTTLYFRQGFVS